MKKSKLFQAKKNYAELSALIQEGGSNIRSNHGPVLAAIKTFQNHPSIVNIKQRKFNSIFSF